MANTISSTLDGPQPQVALPNSNAQEIDRVDVPSDGMTPSSDSGAEDEPLYRNQDDAQSIIQLALSPIATRLTSPKTPAAEKAAAMENLPGGGFFTFAKGLGDLELSPSQEKVHVDGSTSPRKLSKPNLEKKGLSLGQLPPTQPRSNALPSPWRSEPKELVVRTPPGARPALAGVLTQTKHRRASSTGTDTLKRIREALPSLTLPSSFFSTLTSPSFFPGPFAQKEQPSRQKRLTAQVDGGSESAPSRTSSPMPVRRITSPRSNGKQLASETPTRTPAPASADSLTRPRGIRRTTSDESVLYHSLSRVSSLGDDDRWVHVRGQTNSRLKAIRDSWDVPTFKLPQLPSLPSMLSAPLKRSSTVSESPTLEPSEVMSSVAPAVAKDGSQSDLDRALESLTGDIVILGGYRGSILRSTKTHRQVWVPVKVGLNIRKVNLEVGLDPEDEERANETIYPSGMLQHIGPVDVSRRLFKKLKECDNAKAKKLRVWNYGWDWRLSPHLESKKLISFLETLPSNRKGHGRSRGATVICHSLGGLITRHAVNRRPELFAGVVYVGTPQRCVNILGPFRNGDAVLLNEKVLTAQVNFSLRTSFAFLPEDGYCFINRHTGEEFPVDFYDPENWARYAFSPCVGTIQPPYNARPSAFGSLLSLSGSRPNLPLSRSRGNSAPSESRHPVPSPTRRSTILDTARLVEVAHDHTLAPQMGTFQSSSKAASSSPRRSTSPDNDEEAEQRAKYMTYLSRVLAQTKLFRAELAHRTALTQQNLYPPLAVIYGKDIPTVYGAHVTCREAIACADAYDNLVFGSGDGVVLAREAMLPEGYSYVRGGRVSTDKGHISMLGDLPAVGRALEAVMRGRRKGIGLGEEYNWE